MTIKHFERDSGYSIFNECNLVTQFHSHPAMEIIIAKKGSFNLSIGEEQFENSLFALVLPNQLHLFDGENCEVEFILIEPELVDLEKTIKEISQQYQFDGSILLENDYIKISTTEKIQIWNVKKHLQPTYDTRILSCVDFIQTHIKDKVLSLTQLANQVQLSPSRLSHLFKVQVGLPIQKYIIWTRLKIFVASYKDENLNLTQAALQAGFYDAAHFSKHFKEMLGLKPSAVYNSRIVQD